MNVKKLIETLSTFNPKAEVRIADYRQMGNSLPITYVDVIEKRTIPHVGFAVDMFKPKSRKASKKVIII